MHGPDLLDMLRALMGKKADVVAETLPPVDFENVGAAIILLAGEICYQHRGAGSAPCVHCINLVMRMLHMNDMITKRVEGPMSLTGDPKALFKGLHTSMHTHAEEFGGTYGSWSPEELKAFALVEHELGSPPQFVFMDPTLGTDH